MNGLDIRHLDEYQKLALRTANSDPATYRIPETLSEALRNHCGDADGADQEPLRPLLDAHDNMVYSLGLAGEAGEFADIMKKHYGHGHPLDKAVAMKELGDVLWYVAVLAEKLGYDLSEVATVNINKLKLRYAEKFTVEESKNRGST